MNQKPWILLVASEEGGTTSAADRAMTRLRDALQALGYTGLRASSPEDGLALVTSYPSYGCVVIDWDLPGGGRFDEHAAVDIIRAIRARNQRLPICLIADKTLVNDLPLEVVREVHEYIHLYSETPAFIANRLDFAVRNYYTQLLPPYFRELKRFTESGAYQWDAPGHMGGMAYLKHPIGAEFHRFFGENIMRADIGISVGSMGDWLNHHGVPAESERNAARIFGADWTFYVLAGSSNSNRIVCGGAVAADDMVIADRNCHKSLNHGLTLCQARVVYFQPTRNGYGMIGPIPLSRFTPEHIRGLIAKSPLSAKAASQDPTYAVVTNSTYDGLCYHVDRCVEELAKSVPRLHWDEAWYAYAKFHPLYRGRFAMGVPNDMPNRPTLFAVHSTHKMLPAFSMASMIHVKPSTRGPLEFAQFNESFMMHGTTSPFYPMLASIDVATAMMDEPGGPTLMRETILDAINFRQAMVAAGDQVRAGGGEDDWFFGVFQPARVKDPDTGATHTFATAPVELLAREPACWTLKRGESWHGFQDADVADDYCMLDPTKVTILCPGIDSRGQLGARGIPGTILAKFLDSRRTIIARTSDYGILILFSVGTSKGKWGTLLETLFEFKRLYDGGAKVAEALPELAAQHSRYAGMTFRGLCDEMHAAMSELELTDLAQKACDVIPDAVLTSWETYQKMLRLKIEQVKVSEMANRITAHMVVPYPPGIPILMPGERFGGKDSPHIRFLLALEQFDSRFPGFTHEVHGVHADDEGKLWMDAVVEQPAKKAKSGAQHSRQEAVST